MVRDEFCPSVSRVELITCPREATSDHVAAPVECEALKEMLLNGMTTTTDWNGNMEVDISQWSKMEPQLSHVLGVDHKQGTNQSDMCYLFELNICQLYICDAS